MPRDAVSRTANVERTGRHEWVNKILLIIIKRDSSRNYNLLGVQLFRPISQRNGRIKNGQHKRTSVIKVNFMVSHVKIYI